jgi:hypothetical protein
MMVSEYVCDNSEREKENRRSDPGFILESK